MSRWTLKSQLLVGGVLIAMAPLVVASFLGLSQMSALLMESKRYQLKQTAEGLGQMANYLLEDELRFMEGIALNPQVKTALKAVNESGIQANIDRLKALDHFFGQVSKIDGGALEVILITDENGLTFASSGDGIGRKLKMSAAGTEYFEGAQKGMPFVGKPLKSEKTGNTVSMIAIPLKSESGKFKGMIAGILELNRLTEKLREVKLGKTGYVFMVDQSGTMISHPNREYVLKQNISKGELAGFCTQILSGDTGIATYTLKGQGWVSGYAPIPASGWAIGVNQKQAEFMSAVGKMRNRTLIIAFIFLALTVAAVVWLARRIMRLLGKDPADIATIADRIAEGDLTIDFDTDNSKITGIYANMKKMTENLVLMFQDITEGVQTLTASSTELSAVSQEMTGNAGQTSDQAGIVASSAVEMSDAMTSVAAATEQTSAGLQMIVAASEEMSATINEIARNMGNGSRTTSKAVDLAREVSGKVAELGRAAQEINQVTETIADISEQTNLLALNATIEAARAGEAGKGFAVVAGEIKDLARQTADATGEISSKIAKVQDSTSESVSVINAIVDMVNEINGIVTSVASAIEEQSATTKEISENVAQAAEGVNQSNENVMRTTQISGEVSQNIQTVSGAAEEIRAGSVQVNESAMALSRLADTLNQMVKRFKLTA